MRKVLLFVSALALVIGGLAVTASAGGTDLQLCKEFSGLPTDVCATCTTKNTPGGPFSGDTGSAAACDCKFILALDPTAYPSMGACIQAAHAAGIN